MSESTNDPTRIPGRDSDAGGFEITTTWHDRVVVLRASGELDMVTAPRLTESIQHQLSNQPAVVIVDLTEVEFLASAGMTVLIAARQQIGDTAQFAVVADGPATGRPLHLVSVDRLLTIHTTLDAALRACGVESSPGV